MCLCDAPNLLDVAHRIRLRANEFPPTREGARQLVEDSVTLVAFARRTGDRDEVAAAEGALDAVLDCYAVAFGG